MSWMRPDFSAMRMMPSQRDMTPMRGRARVMTPAFAESKAASVSSFMWPVKPPMRTAATTRASQM